MHPNDESPIAGGTADAVDSSITPELPVTNGHMIPLTPVAVDHDAAPADEMSGEAITVTIKPSTNTGALSVEPDQSLSGHIPSPADPVDANEPVATNEPQTTTDAQDATPLDSSDGEASVLAASDHEVTPTAGSSEDTAATLEYGQPAEEITAGSSEVTEPASESTATDLNTSLDATTEATTADAVTAVALPTDAAATALSTESTAETVPITITTTETTHSPEMPKPPAPTMDVMTPAEVAIPNIPAEEVAAPVQVATTDPEPIPSSPPGAPVQPAMPVSPPLAPATPSVKLMGNGMLARIPKIKKPHGKLPIIVAVIVVVLIAAVGLAMTLFKDSDAAAVNTTSKNFIEHLFISKDYNSFKPTINDDLSTSLTEDSYNYAFSSAEKLNCKDAKNIRQANSADRAISVYSVTCLDQSSNENKQTYFLLKLMKTEGQWQISDFTGSQDASAIEKITLDTAFETKYNSSGGSASTADTQRQVAIKYLHGQIEAYYSQAGNYPTLSNLNDAEWRNTNMKGLDPEALKDPSGKDKILVATAIAGSYAYTVGPANCNNEATACATYSLTATLDAGGTYVKSNLN